MKTFKCKLEGISPVLINRFKEQDEIPAKTIRGKKDYGTPRQQAENTAYRDEKTKLLWVPWSWILGTMTTIASDYKLPGRRKSLKSVIGGAVLIPEEKIYFFEKYKVKDIEIDSRPVVIQGKDRIMRHRARLEEWSLEFLIEIDEEIVPVETVHQVLSDAGRRAGLGDYRPQKCGPFGRFHIVSWKEVDPKPIKKLKKKTKKKK